MHDESGNCLNLWKNVKYAGDYKKQKDKAGMINEKMSDVQYNINRRFQILPYVWCGSGKGCFGTGESNESW